MEKAAWFIVLMFIQPYLILCLYIHSYLRIIVWRQSSISSIRRSMSSRRHPMRRHHPSRTHSNSLLDHRMVRHRPDLTWPHNWLSNHFPHYVMWLPLSCTVYLRPSHHSHLTGLGTGDHCRVMGRMVGDWARFVGSQGSRHDSLGMNLGRILNFDGDLSSVDSLWLRHSWWFLLNLHDETSFIGKNRLILFGWYLNLLRNSSLFPSLNNLLPDFYLMFNHILFPFNILLSNNNFPLNFLLMFLFFLLSFCRSNFLLIYLLLIWFLLMHLYFFLLVDLWLILLIFLPYLSLIAALLIVSLVLLLNLLLIGPFLFNHLPSTLHVLLPHLNLLAPTLERNSFLLLHNITKNMVSPLATHSLLRSHFNRFYLLNNPLLPIHHRHILRVHIYTTLLLPKPFWS